MSFILSFIYNIHVLFKCKKIILYIVSIILICKAERWKYKLMFSRYVWIYHSKKFNVYVCVFLSCNKNTITIWLLLFFVLSDKWRVLPIIIHDRESVLNKGLIKLNGAGKTIYLLCTASTLSQQAPLQVNSLCFNYMS